MENVLVDAKAFNATGGAKNETLREAAQMALKALHTAHSCGPMSYAFEIGTLGEALARAEQEQSPFDEWRRTLCELVDAYIQAQSENDNDEQLNIAYAALKAHILDGPFAAPQTAEPKQTPASDVPSLGFMSLPPEERQALQESYPGKKN